ncbi:hypothetical protein BDN71DRAFT_1453496 [Pleurotus eryngii]|uniref:Uncharacterized protein n=1 Tax=Pleurotus eryngii TaxID=5323 RepID=A0A9P6DD80_PLEER|nr:hypothetical protein BDN71DRAFT_1453496 [Pleurotus eryngii]
MVFIRSRNFLCCLPVRYGVFILTVLSILGGGTLAGFGYLIAISQTGGDAPPDKAVEAAFYIQAVVFTAFTFVSVFGIVVVILRSKRLIRLYCQILYGMVIAAVGSGIYSIVVVFYADSNVGCLTNIIDDNPDDCKESAIIGGTNVGVILFVWALASYACVIVPNYAEEIAVKDYLNNPPTKKPTISLPTPQMNTTYNSFTPTLRAEYGFTDPRQSFGVQRSPLPPPNSPLPRTPHPRTPTLRMSISHTAVTHTPIVHTPTIRTPRIATHFA